MAAQLRCVKVDHTSDAYTEHKADFKKTKAKEKDTHSKWLRGQGDPASLSRAGAGTQVLTQAKSELYH